VVNGSVLTHGALTRGLNTSVTGPIRTNTATGLLGLPQIASFSAGSTSVSVEPGQTRNLAPGNYADILVKGSATLNLSAGRYNMRSLKTASRPRQAVPTPSFLPWRSALPSSARAVGGGDLTKP
jgi:hypothetical protein